MMRRPVGKIAPAALQGRFFRYDRATEQITVMGCFVHQVPHKRAAVN
jgi:hypothetical protein